MNNANLLILNNGLYSTFSIIPIDKPSICIGRLYTGKEPDIYFSNPYISKEHLYILVEGDEYYAIDYRSKHGTSINNIELQKNNKYLLKDGDYIKLAKNKVIIMFQNKNKNFETLDFPFKTFDMLTAEKNKVLIHIIPERREVSIDNHIIKLPLKLYELCCILFENINTIVSHNEIRKSVWKEREKDSHGIPLVSDQEITRLIDRLRREFKSTKYNYDYGYLIKSSRGAGYILEIKESNI